MVQTIHVLAEPAADKGDLFSRGMRDLVHALGYGDVRLNVSKSGREVDIQATHRVEGRRLVAECKAHASPIGGADLNKFGGVVLAERLTPDRTGPHPVEGYFISLSGFTGTALQQEDNLTERRFNLLDADSIIKELVRGRIIVPLEKAALAAGSLVPANHELDGADLLLHDVGWVWAIYLKCRGTRAAFILVHADGACMLTSLAHSIEPLFGAAAKPGDLALITPEDSDVEDVKEEEEAKAAYLSYVARELGHITLEGLPTDESVNARQLRLEDLFIPMNVYPVAEEPDDASPLSAGDAIDVRDVGHQELADVKVEEDETDGGETDEVETDRDETEEDEAGVVEANLPVGQMLATVKHVAILGMPGAGKSTLLKRLAVAYVSESRRQEANDGLPDRVWLPVVLRCRQLGALAREPMTRILEETPVRAELNEHQAGFARMLAAELRAGRVLLLVDGLDEIADPGDRRAFVQQLRTFVSCYPATQLVVTSRESGFRAVAETIADLCVSFRICDLSPSDITTLTLAWHRQVVSDRQDVMDDAMSLAARIIATDRVHRLARNPLLLTTLLLVKRWVGDLPRKRSVLYAKAIEVLLATWNVEGHEPLDRDEIMPQLAFVAHKMMTVGMQALPADLLSQWLREARRQMPEELGYARMSVGSLVQRVEERSSLLSLSGYDVHDGRLQPLYEFKHLTFQEYLAAEALANGWFDGATSRVNVEEVLEPHMQDPQWMEVIPLTAVLSGRRAGGIVRRLVHLGKREIASDPVGESAQTTATDNLLNCLLDEVSIGPELVRDAVTVILKGPHGAGFEELLTTRFSEEIEPLALSLLDPTDTYAFNVANHWSMLIAAQARAESRPTDACIAMMQSSQRLERLRGYLLALEILFEPAFPRVRHTPLSTLHDGRARVFTELTRVPRHDTGAESFAWCWAVVWGVAIFDIPHERKCRILALLQDAWLNTTAQGLLGMVSWLIWAMPINRDVVLPNLSEKERPQLLWRRAVAGFRDDDVVKASVVLDFYHRIGDREEIYKSLDAKRADHSHLAARLRAADAGEPPIPWVVSGRSDAPGLELGE